MRVYLVDGTYELFRHFFALPSHVTEAGIEVGATRGVLGSVVGMLEEGATHLGVATDRVVRSFRNDLWPGYKTDAGVPPELLSQFPLVEEGLEALGVVLFPMVELEADDALAAAARSAAADPRVTQVLICTPDKDLAQAVSGKRVVMFDRRKRAVLDAAGVAAKFGVPPESIPDYLALVGDSADGYPGLPGWGAKSAAAVLARYGHLEDIPIDARRWKVDLRGTEKLAATLVDQLPLALLFRDLATLRDQAPVLSSVDDLCWQGPRPGVDVVCRRFDAAGLVARVNALAGRRAAKGS